MHKTISFLVIILCASLSCSDETLSPDRSTFNFDYFPIDSSFSITYKVTTINIDAPLDIRDTSVFFIKEHISGISYLTESDTTYKIIQYYSINEDSLWTVLNVWSLRFDGLKIVKSEDNQEFVKMTFPLSLESEWNGNAFNNLDEELYSVVSLHRPDTVNSLLFDSVAKIEHINYKSIYDKKYGVEKFARGIGLIYKYREEIESQGSDIDYSKPIETRITKGFIYKQEILQYPF